MERNLVLTDPYNPRVRDGRAALVLVLALTAGLAVGCSRGDRVPASAPNAAATAESAPAAAAPATTPVPAAPAAPPAAAPPAGDGVVQRLPPAKVVFLGDSLTAGYGLAADQAFPQIVGEELRAQGTPIEVLNAGVSGDTSAGGLRRLSWVLRQKPDVVVVALGANDGLRGQPPAAIEANLREVVERSRAAGASVLLLGIRVPPSLGGSYAEQFAAVYPRVARDLDVPLVPFFLEGVAGLQELNQPDGIHPNAEGQRLVARNVMPALTAVLRERAATRARAVAG